MRWLTSVSEPVSAEEAVTSPCPKCSASSGKACVGGGSGWISPQTLPAGAEPRAWVMVHVERLEVQEQLL